MAETQLPDVLTPITPASLYKALRTVDPTLSRASLLVLLAQVAEETGWRACHCYNLGNVKHVSGDGRDFCCFQHDEYVNGIRTWPDPAKDPFRAYSTLEDGAADYLELLKHRFSSAWPSVLAGDPKGFVHALKLAHYFTGDEATYTRNVVALDAQLAREIPEEPPLAPMLHAALAQSMAKMDPGQPTPPEDLTA